MRTPEGKKPFGRPESRWKKILKRIFKKWDEEAWSELIWIRIDRWLVNLLKPTGHVMHKQFNI